MNTHKLIAAMGLVSVMGLSNVSLAADEGLSAAQKAEVKALIGSYLKENPEVVIEAIQAWRSKQEAAESAMISESIKELMAEAKNTASPVWGNPKGDVTVVEFFDYNCPYCKSVFPSMHKLVKEDGNIKVVMKEFPVLGENSVYAAKAALAAQKQGKYEQFHSRMMSKDSRLSRDGVIAAAKQVGLDVDRLKKDMESSEVQEELDRSSIWAQRLGIGGTPAFVIGEELIPGAIDGGQMKRYVEKARAAK
ncbi:DsbA family protein [Thiolapillus brandeum]|uniref:DsbA oxidoreductase n=1 Tax=Thiolapillus brandeum TaxID=1076588 RepID=A0A7U6GKF3_9GAMM|nr:DsbA family protein [Thiolapillus brandeum]BAO45237.1 DsbA oxidoreductase [Thiolapillus brandeum]